MEDKTKIPGEPPKISPKIQNLVFESIKEDSFLPIHIQAKGNSKKPSECRKILMTGVTGHLGPYLLQQLSQQDSVTHIYCIVRASNIESAKTRVIARLSEANLLNETNVHKMCFIPGDISKPNLGVDKTSYMYLAHNIDAVVNNAAHVSHIKQYPLTAGSNDPKQCKLRAVNVTGVKNILEFASTGNTKPVLHGSSFACVNRAASIDGKFSEEFPEEDNLGDGIFWGYGYSKFVGEKLAKIAFEERGIPVTVIRYSNISGHSTTGYTAVLDNFTMLVLSFWSSGLFIQNGFGLCVMPVDICAHLAIKLFFNDNAANGVYNLTPPLSTTVNDMYEMAKINGLVPIRKASYEEYFQTILNHDDKSNEMLMMYKKLYSEGKGLKELFHSTPALRLGWYDPSRVLGISKKVEKYVPGHAKLIPSPHQYLQTLFDFIKNSKRFPHLGINFNAINGGFKSAPKSAFLIFFCFTKPIYTCDGKPKYQYT